MPERLLFVISGILIPGFCIELCCFWHPLFGPWWFCRVCCFASCWGPFSSWHRRCHLALISIAGCNPTSWCSVLFGCLFGWFASLCELWWIWQYTGLRNGSPPVYFWGHSTTGRPHDLINQFIPICNMHQNMVNDLAEAMKALDGKKQTTEKHQGPG